MLRIQRFVCAMLLASPTLVAAQDRLNIRTNPLMVFGSIVHLEVDVRVGERSTIGPAFMVHGSEPTYSVGLRYNWFEQGAFQPGWMFTAAAMGGEEVYEFDYTGEFDDTVDGFRTRSVAGLSADQAYFWRWDTFNTTLGLGARLEYWDREDALSLHSDIHFSIGWVR